MSAALICLALAAAGWPTRPRRPVVPDPVPAVRRRPFRLALPGPVRLAVGAGSVATVLATPVVGALAAVCGAAGGRGGRPRGGGAGGGGPGPGAGGGPGGLGA